MSDKEKFSFKEMEYIAVEFAKSCMRGYKGSFEDYMSTKVNKDWRPNLKRRLKLEKGAIEDYHRHITTPYLVFRDLNISKSNSFDNGCNCGQPSCSFGCS